MKRFNELLSETMDETMRQFLGGSVSMLIHALMERHLLLKREEVGEKIEVLHAYLEKLLGSEGAQIIQTASFKQLCLKLRREYEQVEEYFSCLDELYEIKFKLLASPSKQEGLVCS